LAFDSTGRIMAAKTAMNGDHDQEFDQGEGRFSGRGDF